jgi:hypothetical protein
MVDPQAVAKGLAAFQKIPVLDAIQKAKKAWGIPAEHLDEAQAAACVQALGVAGVRAEAVASESLAILPDPTLIAGMQMFPTRWHLKEKSGKSHEIAPGDLNILAACAIKETRSATTQKTIGPSAGQKLASFGIMMATGLPIRIGPKKQTIEATAEHSELFFYAELHAVQKAMRFRIDAQHFDYGVLGAAKDASIIQNFPKLLQMFAQAAPAALQNRGAQIWLAHRPLLEMGYQSLHDLDRECRWLLTLARRTR